MKKYILFIVEGNNDKREIQAIIRAVCGHTFLERYVDAYHVHNGDITTEKDSSEKTITSKLNKIVISWRNGGEQPFQKISPSDVFKVIHIVDMDGVFIPESAILSTDDAKAQYYDSAIHFIDREAIVGRNRKKANVIRKLLTVKQIDNIPYEIYFVSCNMDHLLFNQRNSIAGDKNRNAFAFAGKCKEKSYLQNSVYADGIRAEGLFSESWEMIQKDFNSLHRHANINIFLDCFLSELIEMERTFSQADSSL